MRAFSCAGAGLLVFAATSQASIVYTNPTNIAIVGVPPAPPLFPVNLDGGAGSELILSGSSDCPVGCGLRILIASGVEVASGVPLPDRPTRFAQAFSETDVVGPRDDYSTAPAFVWFGANLGGPYPTAWTATFQTLYVGVRLTLADGVHYGWVGLKRLSPANSVQYRFQVTGFAYESTPGQPIIAGDLGCLTDFNRDGVVDPDDLADYVSAFFASPADPRADFNFDGSVDPDDLSDYIASYFACH